jgi:cadmium resistance protein CadD (predicted permease)
LRHAKKMPIKNAIVKFLGNAIVPFVLIGLGVYILYESETYQLLPFAN